MATIPPGTPPNTPPGPPPGYDPREQRRWYRDQARAQRAAWKAQRMHWRWQVRSARRGSVLGPLVLIGIGVVFLLIQTGRIDRNEFFGLYAHWWPLLLVAAGLIVLAEWALDQFQMRDPERPQYRRSIGGGVVVLLLFLIFAGVAVDAGLAFHRQGDDNFFLRGFNFDQDSWEALFGDKHEFDQTLDLAAPANGTLTIVNPRGDVTVTGTSGDGQIHIAEHKIIYAGSDSDAEDRAQQMAPKTDTDGSETRITVHSVDGAHADLTVTVPPEDATTVNVDRGDIHLSSIKAAVNATTNHGSVELASIAGPASVDINSGGASLSVHNLDNGLTFHGRAGDVSIADVTGPVTINGDIFGSTHVERINGTVHYHTSRTDLQLVRLDGEFAIGGLGLSAEQAQGPVVLATSNHNISLDRMAGDISITNHNGAVELTAAPVSGNQLGNITIENRNGSVKTTLPEHAGFVVQATTTNGDIDTNLTFTSGGQREEDRNEKTLNGTVGSAADAPTVHIRTANGDVSIMSGDVQPLSPPAPPAKITTAPAAPAPAAPKTPKTVSVAAKASAASAAPATPNP